MGKRRNKRRNAKPRVDESGNIVVMTSLEHTHAAMPKYNGWQCRGGVHGDTKYVREHNKRDVERYISEWD